jgi:hypothetical protein
MKTFLVRMPIVGVASIEIEAEDEESAIQAATDQIELAHIDEWEAVRSVCQGNIFYGPLNEVEVEEVEE